MPSKYVPEQLREKAKLFEQRNRVYKDVYKRFGSVAIALFPEGLTLKSEADFNKAANIFQIIGKLSRLAHNFEKGHDDSLDDISVYSMMLKETYIDERSANEFFSAEDASFDP